MKFNISRNELHKGLTAISKAVKSSVTLPITECVKIDVSQGNIILTTTNTAVEMSCFIKHENVETGSFCVEFSKLSSLVKNLTDQPLNFDISETMAIIKTVSGKYEIPTQTAEHFPLMKVSAKHQVKIPYDSFSNGIKSVAYASGVKDDRDYLMGVFMEFGEEIKYTATDANRLNHVKSKISGGEGSVIIPNGTIQVLPESKGEVLLFVQKDAIAIFYESGISVKSRLIDGVYPAYNNIVPKDNDKIVDIDRVQLLSCLKRLSIFSSSSGIIKFDFSVSGLKLTADNIDFSVSGEELIQINWQHEDLQIGFSNDILQESLSSIKSDAITFSLYGPNRAGLITSADSEDAYILVMPMIILP